MINSIKRCKHRKDVNHNPTRILVTVVLIGTKVSIVSNVLAPGRGINSNANLECRGIKKTCEIVLQYGLHLFCVA
jgi:hypothetical protein